MWIMACGKPTSGAPLAQRRKAREICGLTRYSQDMKRSFAALLLACLCTCRNSAPPLATGIDLAGMDKSVAPGDDFNAYANGGWLKATPIPADKASYGVANIIADQTRERVRDLIQQASGK